MSNQALLDLPEERKHSLLHAGYPKLLALGSPVDLMCGGRLDIHDPAKESAPLRNQHESLSDWLASGSNRFGCWAYTSHSIYRICYDEDLLFGIDYSFDVEDLLEMNIFDLIYGKDQTIRRFDPCDLLSAMTQMTQLTVPLPKRVVLLNGITAIADYEKFKQTVKAKKQFYYWDSLEGYEREILLNGPTEDQLIEVEG